MRWLPRFALMGSSLSDDQGPDADGLLISIEWFGFIVEVAGYRRSKEPLA